jgi:hypothetical protein
VLEEVDGHGGGEGGADGLKLPRARGVWG